MASVTFPVIFRLIPFEELCEIFDHLEEQMVCTCTIYNWSMGESCALHDLYHEEP